MKVQEKVLVVWQSLSYYERRMVGGVPFVL